MRSLSRLIGLICLIALVLTTTALFAQEEITATGSGIVAPIFEAAAEAGDTAVTVDITGTDRGFEAFCQGQADLALATRALSTDEEFNCSAAGVQFLELLAGYNAVALVSSAESTFDQCLTTDQLRTLLAPSAQGQVTDWTQVNAENASGEITLFVPSDTSPVYAALDALVEGVGIRSDVQVAENDEETIGGVSSNPNAVGVVSYASAAAAGDNVRTLQLNTGTAGCVAPSLESIEGREYGGADRLFVYVNSASLSKPGMTDLLNAALSEAAQETVESLNLVAPSAETYATNQQSISENQTGRLFTRDVDTFTIPTGLIGTLNLGGSPVLNNLMNSLTAAFTTQQPGVTINQTYVGEPDGIRRLCNGELDVAVAFSDLTAEQIDNCEANNIATVPVELGSQAVVLLANGQSDYLTCLTAEQLGTTWSAASADTIITWNQVSPDLPETALTLFAPETANAYTDLLMYLTTDAPAPSRVDVQLNDDVSYRVAAVGAVEGALTYMSWQDYRTIEQSSLANVTPVAVDDGNGCVEPSEEAITDGSYPLTRPVRLLVRRSALARPEVQSLLWFLISDENYSLITDAGLVGLSFADLTDLRFSLQEVFEQAQAEAAQIVPESTAEATPDAEATSETEATSEPASEAEDVTPEATEAAG